jgi:hypothetical protein
MLILGGDDRVIVGKFFVRRGEGAHLAPDDRATFLLFMQELLGFKELRLHERIIGDQLGDGLDHERVEVLLQPRDLVEALHHLAHADADHLALPASRIQDFARDDGLTRGRGGRRSQHFGIGLSRVLGRRLGAVFLAFFGLPRREETALDRYPRVVHDATRTLY